MWLVPRPGPVARISLGLVALVVVLLTLADLLLGVVPDRTALEGQLRLRASETFAVQIAALMESDNQAVLNKTLRQVVSRDPAIQSIGIRRNDGSLVAQAGDHARLWVVPQAGEPVADQVKVPILSDRNHWGDVETRFVAAGPRTFGDWITQPVVLLVLILVAGGSGLYYVYLRRAMQFLDPSATVPDRVRKTLDFLVEGVLILDQQGRIVLANQAFRKLYPATSQLVYGQSIAELTWLKRGDSEALAPWSRTLREATPVIGEMLTIHPAGGATIKISVSCSPIMDNNNRMRGCLVAFDDVTEIYDKNQKLEEAYDEVKRVHEKIKIQNEELQQLASRDPLTGCLNRRAFFEEADGVFAQALHANANLCCIMVDIDLFKGFNDLYGHSVGDQVIQVMARTLTRSLHLHDILCRYGGEEFCIILPNTTLENACKAAERIRLTIEKNGSAAVTAAQVKTITSSFGVASLAHGVTQIAELIDRADEALYESKKNGRNRVSAWQPPAD